MKSPVPDFLSIAELCRLEPALFCASRAMPPACEPLQWPVLDWTGHEQAERLAA